MLIMQGIDLSGGCTEWTEERTHVLGQQFGFLQRGEMPTSWHLRPALHAQGALCLFARGDPYVFGKDGNPRRDFNVLPRFQRWRRMADLVIHAHRGERSEDQSGTNETSCERAPGILVQHLFYRKYIFVS